MSRSFLSLLLIGTVSSCFLLSGESFARDYSNPPLSCDKEIPNITSGYGADGPYKLTRVLVSQPDFTENVQVFLPAGKTDRSPVMFFSHGYGPNLSSAYAEFISHTVSRGTIVVFSPFPLSGTMSNRYDILWNGFVRATEAYGNQMDLSHIAVVGHSFGGGAVPTIAYRAFAEKGWGSAGGLAFSLAPWYTEELTDAQWASIPSNIVFATQVYDQDTMNDHRMAINQFAVTPGQIRLYMMVHTLQAGSCVMTAVHMLPVDSGSLRIKQYALFRPLDALTDMAFQSTGSDPTSALQKLTEQLDATTGYQPLELFAPPTTTLPQSTFNFPWDAYLNPAASKSPPDIIAQPKSPPDATPRPKSPPDIVPQPKSPPDATPRPKSPPDIIPQPKSPPDATPRPKSPPDIIPQPKSPPD